jgi:hypothetical protein
LARNSSRSVHYFCVSEPGTQRDHFELSIWFSVRLEAIMLLRIVAIATVPAWILSHAAAAAAQTFDERWSIIPNAHAEPARPPLPAEPAPATPEERKPDM